MSLSKIKNFFSISLVPMIKHRSRKSILNIVIDVLILTKKIKYFPTTYFKYEGYRIGNKVEDYIGYLPGSLFHKIRNKYLNDKRYFVLAEDKVLFNQFAKLIEVPTTNIVAEYTVGHSQVLFKGSFVALEFLFRKINHDFVIKPAIDSAQGKGVLVFDYDHKLDRFNVNGQNFDRRQMMAYIDKKYANSRVLIEEKLEQHDGISKIYNLAINSIRIDTLKSYDGKVIINDAFLRVGRNGRRVDNWSGIYGGIGVGINIETGLLNSEGVDYCSKRFKYHPDSHVKFNNVQIPYWEQVQDIVLKAAKYMPGLNSIGWDVAITKNGPAIIEANHGYDLLGMQACTEPYLCKKDFVQYVSEYLKVRKGYKYAKYIDYRG